MATFPVKERFDNLYNYPLGEEPPSAAPVTEVTNVRKKIDPVTGSIITGAIGSAANLIMNYSNNRANDRRQQEAYEQNLRMWHLQNQYNSPASQIARLKAAGLNPNLIYGNPDNTAQAPPSKGVSEGHAGQVDPMLAMNAMSIAKQMEVADSQIQRNQAEAMNFEAGARNYDADSLLKGEELSWRPTQRQMEQEIVRFTNMLRESEAKLTDEQRRDLSNRIDEWLKFAPQREQEFTNRLNQQIEDLNLTKEQKKYYRNLAAKISKEFEFLEKQIGVLFSPSKWKGKSLFQANYEFGVDYQFRQNSLLEIQESIQRIYSEIYNTPEFKESMKTKFELQDDWYFKLTQRLNQTFEPFKGFIDFEFNLFNSTNGVPTPKVKGQKYTPTYTM